MKNQRHEEVKQAAITYATGELGWKTAEVTGIIEDSASGAHFLVRVQGLCEDNGETGALVPYVVALLIEWLPESGWTVIDETDNEDFERNASVLRDCSYCWKSTRADQMVGSVCRTCNRNGIEA